MFSIGFLLGMPLYLLLVVTPWLVQSRYAVVLRQDSISSTASQQGISTQTPSASTGSIKEPQHTGSAIASVTRPTSTPEPASLASKAASSTESSSASNDNAASIASSNPAVLVPAQATNSISATSSSTSQIAGNELPIRPEITPALSVAGAFLMLSGLFYTLIGIKTKWLHTFLSAAYLTSLATTVLIIYVMHPPISSAVQGAFLVAAVVTGLIFGGGSVIFADITEGLGCLLGGYSLAMWFLVLTPGGLIKSTAGKAIFIACFTFGAFGLYIWKLIKRRREQRATERSRQEHLQEEAEENRGRKVEEGNQRDRIMWEAAYGKKNGTDRHIDSGVGTEAPSVGKGSRSDSIELNDLERGTQSSDGNSTSEGKGKARTTVTVRVASDDDVIQKTSLLGSTTDLADPLNPLPDVHIFSPKASSSISDSRDNPPSQLNAITSSSSPKVIPLPFKVPRSDHENDRRSSIAASIASDHRSNRMLKRLSGGSLRRTSSKRSQRSYIAASTSEEALMITYNDDDDRASSVEAAVDEVSDGHRSEVDGTTLAGLPTPDTDERSLLKFSPPTEPHPMERPGRKISQMSLGQASSKSLPTQEKAVAQETTTELHPILSEDAADNNPPVSNQSPRARIPSLGSQAEGDPKEPTTAEEPASPNAIPEKTALRESLAGLTTTSKIGMTYRTNEWAKHLDRAEKPSLDDLRTSNPTSQFTGEKAIP
ncbi:MAG: hypothetical protein Q9170_007827, partial [Blastenia crenularia]